MAPGQLFSNLFGVAKPVIEVAGESEAPARQDTPRGARVGATEFLAPCDLQITPTEALRLLAIGSCFLQSQIGAYAQEGLEIDFALVNHLHDFPAEPPAPLDRYDYQLVQIPLRSVMPDELFAHLDHRDVAAHAVAFEAARGMLARLLQQRMAWNLQAGTPTFVMNFLVPQFGGMGRFFPRYDLRNVEYFVAQLNQALEGMLAKYRAAYLLDVDRLAASIGRRYLQDDVFTVFGHGALMGPGERIEGRIDPLGAFGDYYDTAPGAAFGAAVIAEMRAMHRTLRQMDSVKLVVVDLDDTMWTGVSGDSAEIGFDMVEGWPIGLAEALTYLRKRGILLAIISKNDEDRIRAIWPRIFHDRLKLDDFAAIRINWQPKQENMAGILGTLNLLPRNVLFIDDNPAERAQMRGAFPAMRVIGANPFHFRRVLLLAPETQSVTLSEESAQRTGMVQAQAAREADRTALSPADFAQQQDVRLRMLQITDVAHKRFARALELINKTNQFNTTGRRWTEAECAAFFAAGGVMHAYRVEDRYTHYGLVGVVLVQSNRILQWVMSCRTIGMGVEYAALAEIAAGLRRQAPCAIEALLEDTDANQPSRGFYKAAGLAQHGATWVLPADAAPDSPAHVTILT